MSDVKQVRQEYRDRAKRMYEDVGMVDSEHIRVMEYANVQLVEGGAFVECVVWVPEEEEK